MGRASSLYERKKEYNGVTHRHLRRGSSQWQPPSRRIVARMTRDAMRGALACVESFCEPVCVIVVVVVVVECCRARIDMRYGTILVFGASLRGRLSGLEGF